MKTNEVAEFLNEMNGESWTVETIESVPFLATFYEHGTLVAAGTAELSDGSQWNIPAGSGYIQDIAVHPDFRGQGYGKNLIQMCEDWCLRTIQVEDGYACHIYAMCWMSGQPRYSYPTFTGLGYVFQAEFKEPWRGTVCLSCGMDCKCSGWLVKKSVYLRKK